MPCAGDGLLRAVTLGIVGRGIEQEIDRLVALQVNDAQRLARRDMVQPRRPRRDDLVVHDGAGKS